MAIKQCSENASANSEAILAIDQRFFCQGNKALPGERIEAVLALMEVFVSDPPDSAENDGEGNDLPPPSMRRTRSPAAQQPDPNETNVFRKALQQTARVSERYIAGILLLDIASYSWKRHAFEAEQSNLLKVSSASPLFSHFKS